MKNELEIVVQVVTLISLILGFWRLIHEVNNYRRQMNAQVFLKYTERYERILEQFPEDALASRFDLQMCPPQTPQLTLCVLKYMNLCAEEYYLKQQGYLAESLWSIWEGDLKRMIGSPLLQREWISLRSEFISHQDFLQYVEGIQAISRTSNAAHA